MYCLDILDINNGFNDNMATAIKIQNVEFKALCTRHLFFPTFRYSTFIFDLCTLPFLRGTMGIVLLIEGLRNGCKR